MPPLLAAERGFNPWLGSDRALRLFFSLLLSAKFYGKLGTTMSTRMSSTGKGDDKTQTNAIIFCGDGRENWGEWICVCARGIISVLPCSVRRL